MLLRNRNKPQPHYSVSFLLPAISRPTPQRTRPLGGDGTPLRAVLEDLDLSRLRRPHRIILRRDSRPRRTALLWAREIRPVSRRGELGPRGMAEPPPIGSSSCSSGPAGGLRHGRREGGRCGQPGSARNDQPARQRQRPQSRLETAGGRDGRSCPQRRRRPAIRRRRGGHPDGPRTARAVDRPPAELEPRATSTTGSSTTRRAGPRAEGGGIEPCGNGWSVWWKKVSSLKFQV
jgi:hypothetical protein